MNSSVRAVVGLAALSLASAQAPPPPPPTVDAPTLTAPAEVDPKNPFGWSEFLLPKKAYNADGPDWESACEAELKPPSMACYEENRAGTRGERFGCLLKNLKETDSKACLNAMKNRNARTLADAEAARAQAPAQVSADSTYTKNADAPAAPAGPSYRETCSAEIIEHCNSAKDSTVAGELFSCLAKYDTETIDATGQSPYSEACSSALLARFTAANPPPAGPPAGGLVETCTTPFRLRTANAGPQKCLNYLPSGKTSYKPCDMADKAQQFLVRPAMEGGYRFINIDRTICIDSDMSMKDCGMVSTTWDLNFEPLVGAYTINDREVPGMCLGGDKRKPSSSECPKVPAKMNPKAKKALKPSMFYIEAAFGNELSFGMGR